MKRFLIKISFFFTLVIFITLTVNYAYIKCDDYPLLSVRKFMYVPDNIDICNLGSSHGEKDFDYTDLEQNLSCFNFALGSQSLLYDDMILRYFQDRLTDNSVVIIPISFFSIYGIPEDQYDDFQSKNLRYYSFLPHQYILDYDLYIDLMTDKLRAINAGPISCIDAFIHPVRRSYVKSWTTMEDTITPEYEKNLVETGKKRAFTHIIEDKRNENGQLIYNEENINALYDIIETCRKHQAVPVLITVPFLKEYTDGVKKIDPDFLPEFYKWINYFCEENNVKYYDYSTDVRFCNDHTLFYNVDHMNSYGARKFTDLIYSEVIKGL